MALQHGFTLNITTHCAFHGSGLLA